MIDVKPIQTIIRRREEAKKMGRIIHPESFIKEIRNKKLTKLNLNYEIPGILVIQRSGDFIENITTSLRDPENWESAIAGQLIGNIISKFF